MDNLINGHLDQSLYDESDDGSDSESDNDELND